MLNKIPKTRINIIQTIVIINRLHLQGLSFQTLTQLFELVISLCIKLEAGFKAVHSDFDHSSPRAKNIPYQTRTFPGLKVESMERQVEIFVLAQT